MCSDKKKLKNKNYGITVIDLKKERHLLIELFNNQYESVIGDITNLKHKLENKPDE